MHKLILYNKCNNHTKSLHAVECPEETLGIILWPYTEPGDVAIQPCFSNNSTTIAAKRVCFQNGSWAEPDTTNCSAGL